MGENSSEIGMVSIEMLHLFRRTAQAEKREMLFFEPLKCFVASMKTITGNSRIIVQVETIG